MPKDFENICDRCLHIGPAPDGTIHDGNVWRVWGFKDIEYICTDCLPIVSAERDAALVAEFDASVIANGCWLARCPEAGADMAIALENAGRFDAAAHAWTSASGACIGHNRAQRYTAAAARCTRMHNKT